MLALVVPSWTVAGHPPVCQEQGSPKMGEISLLEKRVGLEVPHLVSPPI